MKLGQLLTPLRLEQLDDGYWMPLAPLKYQPASGELIVVPTGFKTDLQSIPPPAWPIVGHPADDYAESGVVHDWLLRYPGSGLTWGTKVRSLRRCDQIYLEVNQDEGCPWWKRTLKYTFLRAFSWRSWRRYRKADREREQREG